MGTVLLVDDDQEIRAVLRLALEDEGYTTQEAADGFAALDVLRHSEQPMIVLLDLMMPRLNGAGMLGIVAADYRLAEQHSFILITAMGHTLPRPLMALLDALNVTLLFKPLDLDVLTQTVARAEQRLQQRSRRSQYPARPTPRRYADRYIYDGLDSRPQLIGKGRDTHNRVH